ncbi:MAG: hypothetical protein JRN26_07595 [Nitrososphaerota archaeon]|jgi:hypothetical protein|nr:hypothetical protein [Nitrososphaerota archaeon]MDG6927319.1 hypothetical protein [Nitrososphaerota archaeon]MDG6930779.1 hypothetical protein [Nitrososphaerota archaeon]MDG6931679.1 hypothetical protein [Nitrososphaerota archaeon]MDG6936727.1 hypothetical protein [Nitrososphaerota archaeon]
MEYIISIVLDENRFNKIRGTALEGKVKGLFGGALKVIDLPVTEEQAKKILEAFPKSRIDARKHIEETPVSFRRELFDLLAVKGDDALDEILNEKALGRLKSLSLEEDDHLNPP